MTLTKEELIQSINDSYNNDSDPLLHNDVIPHLLFKLNNNQENINEISPITGNFTINDLNKIWTIPVVLSNYKNGYEISIILSISGLGINEFVELEFIVSNNNGATFANGSGNDITLILNENTSNNIRSKALMFNSSTFDTIGLEVINNSGTTYSIVGTYSIYRR